MSSRKSLSIIIPAYNCAKYIQQCINSVRQSTYPVDEIIIINDGSSDETPRICEKLKSTDERIIFVSQENKGVSAARNTGLEIASGEYIGFVDADDYIHPQMYEVLINALESHNTDIAHCSCVRTTRRDFKFHEPNVRTTVFSHRELLKKAITDQFTSFCVRVYKREIIKPLRFVEGIFFEDVELTLKVFDHCKKGGAFVDFIGYAYFINPKGTTKQRNSQFKMDKLHSFLRNEELAAASYPECLDTCRALSSKTAVSALQWGIILNDLPKEKILFLRELTQKYLSMTPCPLKWHKKLLARILLTCPTIVAIVGRIFFKVDKLLKSVRRN